MGGTGDSCQNGKVPSTGATEVNYEPPASGQLVFSVNYLMGLSYEACASIKTSNLFLLKWQRKKNHLLRESQVT